MDTLCLICGYGFIIFVPVYIAASIIHSICNRDKLKNEINNEKNDDDSPLSSGLMWNVDLRKSYMAGNIHNHHNREDSSRSSAFNDSIGGGFDSSSGGFGGGFGGSPFD